MSQSQSPSPFRSLEASFRLLCRGERQPLSIDGHDFDGLPARTIALDELSSMFAHPSFRERWDVRDAVLHELATKAQQGDASSVVGLAGMLLAGLRSKAARLRRQFPTSERAVIESELLAGLLGAVADDVPVKRVAARLLDGAFSTARTQLRVDARATRHLVHVDDDELCALAEHPSGNPEEIVRAAVAEGAVTEDEAELIMAVHFEDSPVSEQAGRLGISYRAACQRLRRAELRLVAAMFNRRVPSRRSVGGVSNTGPRAGR